MVDIFVKLAVIAADGYCLMLKGQGDPPGGLPGGVLSEDDTSRDMAHRLLKESLGLTHGEWTSVSQVGLIEDGPGAVPVVLYTACLPERVSPLRDDLRWVRVASLPSGVEHLVQLACMYNLNNI